MIGVLQQVLHLRNDGTGLHMADLRVTASRFQEARTCERYASHRVASVGVYSYAMLG